MKLYSENENYKLYQGSMLDMLEVIEKDSVSSIVTDPPYELNFMNKGWDNSGIAFKKETWEKCYQVLKPGGYLLAFGGSRTYHRIACAIEDAGFEIRDTILWLYGSGFPKSLNIGLAIDKKNGVDSKVVGTAKSGSADTHTRTMSSVTKEGKSVFGGEYEIKQAQNEWAGWGSCLKPAFEPVIVARKPFEGSLTDNVIKNGVGGLNIDECRVDLVGNEDLARQNKTDNGMFGVGNNNNAELRKEAGLEPVGRFPANVILTYDETDKEEVIGGFPEGAHTGHRSQTSIENCIENRKIKKGNSQCDIGGNIDHITEYTDYGSAARYFYCAKASKRDRDEGLDVKEPIYSLNEDTPEEIVNTIKTLLNQ